MTLYYSEGDWLAIPNSANTEYALCLVARLEIASGNFIGVFFNITFQSVPVDFCILRPSLSDVILIDRVAFLKETNCRWPVIMHSHSWRRDEWTIPPFSSGNKLKWYDEDAIREVYTLSVTKETLIDLAIYDDIYLENVQAFMKHFSDDGLSDYIAAEDRLFKYIKIANTCLSKLIVSFDVSRVLPIPKRKEYWPSMAGQQVVTAMLRLPGRKTTREKCLTALQAVDTRFRAPGACPPEVVYDGAVVHDRYAVLYWHGADAHAIADAVTPHLLTVPYQYCSYLVKYFHPPGIQQERVDLPAPPESRRVAHPRGLAAEEILAMTPLAPADFWAHIAAARRGSGGESEVIVERLAARLMKRPAREIIAFELRLRQLRAESYRWDLWGAAFLINDGASDDGFEAFRGWLIAQGEDIYERALSDPESLAEIVTDEMIGEEEGLLYVAQLAYEEKTGESFPDLSYPLVELVGNPWEEDDLPARFPRLWQRRDHWQKEEDR